MWKPASLLPTDERERSAARVALGAGTVGESARLSGELVSYQPQLFRRCKGSTTMPRQIGPKRHSNVLSSPPHWNHAATVVRRDFYSIRQLADRWSCSRGTVYNVLRSTGTSVVDFAAKGRKGHKLVPIAAVKEIERRKLRRLS
jgi:hypothetical protein